MKPRFVNVDRRTPLLLSPDLREWVPSDHLAHFVVDLVEEVAPPGGLFDRVGALVEAISRNAPGAIRGSKAVVRVCARDPYLDSVQDTALPMVDAITSGECRERLAAFLNREKR